MKLNVKVEGVEELRGRIAGDIISPQVEIAIGEVAAELSTPKGGGLAVEKNSLMMQLSSNMATVTTSLVHPRTTGESWAARSEEDFEDIAERALQAAAEQIAAAWEG
jgi:hypothetical protein